MSASGQPFGRGIDSAQRSTRRLARRRIGDRLPELLLASWGFALSLAWEIAQTPLYADAGRGLTYLGWTRLHCAVGDVLILMVAFWVTAGAFRDRFWIQERRPGAIALFVMSGLVYTIWSEWWNVAIARNWAYAEAMPTVFGIGVAPLLQWLVVPILAVTLVRRFRAPRDSQVTERS
ncbi:MAG: hypothetical protein ABIV06_12745 [Thermoanaerobaculia bacterium]